MTTVVALAFVLAAVFVATESRRRPSLAMPDRYEACNAIMTECTSSLRNNQYFSSLPESYRATFENLDNVCEDYRSTADCLRPQVESCDAQINRKMSITISIGDFLCSDRGKSLLREFQESDCYENFERVFQVERFARQCTVELGTNLSINPSCQIANDVVDCTARNTKEMCGEAACDIVKGIAARLISIKLDLECTIDAAGDLVRNHLNDFK